MTTTVAEPTPAPAEVGPNPPYDETPAVGFAGWLRRAWLPVLIALLVVATAVGLAIVGAVPVSRPLDPTDASPSGARAIVQLLRQQGVEVRMVRDVDALRSAPDTTVVISFPDVLGPDELATLSENLSDILLVAPHQDVLSLLGIPAEESGDVTADKVVPECDLPEATAAGTVTVDGPVYTTTGTSPNPVTSCYPVAGLHSVLVTTGYAGRTFTVVGSRAVLANHTLDQDGNAALALGLLTGHPKVDWLIPVAPTEAQDTERHGLLELLPGRLWWAVLMVVIALVFFAFSRCRRLGPLVTEPLPVVVRATETVEGRARLLRAARARTSGADALRGATRRRLALRLGLGAAADQTALVDRVVARTGRSGNDVTDLLYGSSPADDRALVALAAALDALEEEMRRQ
jgi:hypothetical protein